MPSQEGGRFSFFGLGADFLALIKGYLLVSMEKAPIQCPQLRSNAAHPSRMLKLKNTPSTTSSNKFHLIMSSRYSCSSLS